MVGKSKKPDHVDPKVEREELLERIWINLARKYADILERTDAMDINAATLTAAQKFLNDNAIRKDTLTDKQGDLMATLGQQVADAMADADADQVPPLPEPQTD